MAYIGFDLDETLGRFSTPDGYLYFLMPDAFYSRHKEYFQLNPPPIPSVSLQTKLSAAFQTFVECLAKKEPELGLLRPGILEIMGTLAKLKEEGSVKGIVVYSNNGNIACLHLATKMIEYLLGKPGLFCNLVHLNHPLRSKDYQPRSGQISKTVRVLKEAFVDSRCSIESAQRIPTNQLYFFDDLYHQNIHEAIGEKRYFTVNPYKRDTSFEPLDECFESALISQSLDTDPEYLNYVKVLFNSINNSPKTLADINQFLRKYNSDLAIKREVFLDDTEYILKRLSILFPSNESYGLNYFPVVDGGKRKGKGNGKKGKRYNTRKLRR